MSPSNNSQPLRELEWLVEYFRAHGRDDKAQEILEQLRRIRMSAQDSLNCTDASDVRGFIRPAASTNESANLDQKDA